MRSPEIKNLIFIKGTLKNLSPFIIGSGEGETIDIEVLKNEDGNPYIPATSFVGSLRHYLEENYEKNNSWKDFWGSLENQSHFIVNELKFNGDFNDNLISSRDGVAIDITTGIAKKKAKYDYEIINRPCKFKLNAEIKIRKDFNINEICSIIKTFIDDLKDGKVYFGAMTTKGFGRFYLDDEQIYFFSFPKDGENYLKGLQTEFNGFQSFSLNEISYLKSKQNKDFIIEANFQLKNSLIIGAYSDDPNSSEKEHVKYNEVPVITGTSLKGVIRARAIKIINTLGNDGEKILKEPYGWADIEGKNKKKLKSRLIVEESIIEDVEEEIQTRLKIDRFTSGTIHGALIETKPIWHKNERIPIKIKIRNFSPWEAGLILLILKDIWTSDLQIGGEKAIGRGFLKGISAKIKYDGNEIILKEKNGKIAINKEDKKNLQDFIVEFLKEIGVGE